MIVSTAGFTLLECLIYIAVTALLVMLVTHFFMTTCIEIITHNQLMNNLTWAYSAQELLTRDLETVPYKDGLWKKACCSEIIFTRDAVDIGWSLKNRQLRRTQGQYDVRTARWTQSTTNLVIDKVVNLTFKLIKIKNITRALSYTLVFEINHSEYTLERTVALKNCIYA